MKRAVIFLAVTLMVAALMMMIGPAQASNDTVVTISGTVSNDGITLHVEAQAMGPSAGSLTGQGSDSTARANAAKYCRFPLTGSVSGNVITLSGSVVFSPDPTNLGTPVAITADASTGSITFNFGGFILTGTGSVVIVKP